MAMPRCRDARINGGSEAAFKPRDVSVMICMGRSIRNRITDDCLDCAHARDCWPWFALTRANAFLSATARFECPFARVRSFDTIRSICPRGRVRSCPGRPGGTESPNECCFAKAMRQVRGSPHLRSSDQQLPRHYTSSRFVCFTP